MADERPTYYCTLISYQSRNVRVENQQYIPRIILIQQDYVNVTHEKQNSASGRILEGIK